MNKTRTKELQTLLCRCYNELSNSDEMDKVRSALILEVARALEVGQVSNGHTHWPTWDICEGLLAFLNEKTGKRFDARTYDGKPTRSLQLIHARLHSLGPEKGVDIAEGIILRKWQQWKGTEMEVFLRPSTLFGKEKFEQYRGEVLL